MAMERCRGSWAAESHERPDPRFRAGGVLKAASGSGSVVGIAADVSARRRSAVEVTREALERIAASDGAIGAFLEVTADQALAEARASDARVAAGESLALAGVPVAIKDNMWVAGRTATCGSKILQGYRPPGDATAIARLRRGGGGFGGRGHMEEVAGGSPDREQRLSKDPQSVGQGAHPGGLLGGKRGGGRLADGPGGAGVGHGRLDPAAGRLLRDRGVQAHVRPGGALRAHRVRLLARSDRFPARP